MSNTGNSKAKSTTKAKPTLTGEQIAEMREAGMTWVAIAEKAGLKKGQSGQHLRNAMYRAQGKQTKAKSKAGLGKEVVKRRDAGEGWPKIAAATGLSLAQAREAYSEAGGTNPDGRVYVRRSTNEA